ncbi:cochaperone prefoldin complex subunit, putative [Plasmodium gallinaceum]|uniref:Cochaperone prefoldin complex subunit, putative n=1 Tax=Plasmodium gallinaceum TaxID=5849 RepID=A0A1J1GVJ4_PLAGA|nr:cochaperone prefoldin complex subunit, putative [Plasmodium gallinaceum]CRG96332.1 cochaperone prefoldin complex subunit, putative [Plasmodium gallinaceum]
MACDLEKIEENEREKPNVVIQLNTLGLEELVSLTLKLEEEWKLIKKNYTILESAVVTYDKCKNCVEQLNPSKYEAKNFNIFMNELERSELIKLCGKEPDDKNKSVDIKDSQEKNKLENIDNLIDKIKISNKEEEKEIEKEKEEKEKENEKENEKEKEKEKKQQTLDVHIPLTSLVYIPGKIVDTENFLIRMGTNYYVQRNSEQTIEYFNDKVKRLNEQIKKLKVTLIEKKNEIDLCKNYIQIKREQQINNLNTNTQPSSLNVNPSVNS